MFLKHRMFFLNFWISIYFGFYCLELQAQNIYKDFLLNPTRSAVDSVFTTWSEYYSGSILTRPLINRIELRSETREFRIDKQEYTFRVSTSSPLFNSYQKKINKIETQNIDLLRRSNYAYEIYQKYKLIGKIENLKLKIINLKSELDILGSLIQVNKNPVLNLSKFNYESYYNSLIKYNKVEFELSESQFEYEQLAKEVIGSTSSTQPNIIIASIHSIYEYVSSYTPEDISIEDSINYNDLEISRLEMNQRQTNENKLLDHVQLRYQSDPEELLNRKLSLGIGLRIPGLIKNKYLTDEYKIKSIKATLNHLSSRDKNHEKINEITLKLESLKHQFEFISKQQLSLSEKFKSEEIFKSNPSDFDILLEIKLQNINHTKIINQINAECLMLFVDFLYLTDHFSSQSNLFYLSLPFSFL